MKASRIDRRDATLSNPKDKERELGWENEGGRDTFLDGVVVEKWNGVVGEVREINPNPKDG